MKCTMCDPAELHDLFASMQQEYLNRGGQAVMDENARLWDLEHAAQ